MLIRKLALLGLHDSILKWVESYLTGRQQRVYANDVYSSFLQVTQGVPQGSVLGPLFYIIYANDLPNIVKNCEIALYADDTVLFTASRSFENSVRKMQEDLNSLTGWCSMNGIAANTDKSKVMIFGTPTYLKRIQTPVLKLGGEQLNIVSSYKYLGMTLDCQLNYNLHV